MRALPISICFTSATALLCCSLMASPALASTRTNVETPLENNPTATLQATETTAQSKDVEQFVSRLYRLVLEREPEAEGLANQCAAVQQGVGGAELARNFFLSPEFANRGLSNQEQAAIAYRTMLNREPDSAGLSNWVQAMDCGMTIEGVVAGFSESQEFVALCANWGITPGAFAPAEARNVNFQVTTFIHRLYSLTLNRQPDTEGLNFWCAQYFSGMTCRQLAAGFLGSEEFAKRTLPLPDQVDVAYRAMLDRPAEDQGKSEWAHRLQNGLGMDGLAAGLSLSDEFKALCSRCGLISGADVDPGIDFGSFDAYGPASYTYTVNGITISSSHVDKTCYLMLPSSADLSNLPLSFESFLGNTCIYISSQETDGFKQFNNGDTLNVNSLGLSQDADGALVLYVKDNMGDSKAGTLRIMKASAVPSVYLTSKDAAKKGRNYVESDPEHKVKASASMVMLDPNGKQIYNSQEDGNITVKGRGNTTWREGDKKPYQIKLSKKADLLPSDNDSAKSKTWVLLANANDPTLLRNSIGFDLAKELGLSDTPSYSPVDLYYDGEYLGSYLLCEKVEVGTGRVDVASLEDENEEANEGIDIESLPIARATNAYGQTFQYVYGMNNPDDISGGYLLEADDIYYNDEVSWFETSIGVSIVVKSPEYASEKEMRYISELFERAIRCIENKGVSPDTGQSLDAFMDVVSLAKTYLIKETAQDLDNLSTSFYFYKDKEETIIHAGPVWDFDSAFGLRDEDFTGHADQFGTHADEFGSALRSVQAFNNTVSALYCNQLRPVILNVLLANGKAEHVKSLDAYVNQISNSEKMDQKIWGLSSFYFCIPAKDTYGANVDYLKTWIANRAWWMDTVLLPKQ